LHLNKLSI